MNTMINNRRLDELAAEIKKLDSSLIEHERDSLEVMGSEEDCEASLANVTAARIELDRKLRAYFIENEVVRQGLAALPAVGGTSAAPAGIVDIQPSIDLLAAAREEGLTESKLKHVLRTIARKPTGAQIFRCFVADRIREANAAVRRACAVRSEPAAP